MNQYTQERKEEEITIITRSFKLKRVISKKVSIFVMKNMGFNHP